MTLPKDSIIGFLNKILKIDQFKEDSSHNGLQIQHKQPITSVLLAVDASLRTLAAAKAAKAQLVLVHHGISWNTSLATITGRNYQLVNGFLAAGIGLYAAHAPLDAHPVYGNNAQIASLLGLHKQKPFGYYHTIMWGIKGEYTAPVPYALFLKQVKQITPTPLVKGNLGDSHSIRKVAIVSGGGGFAVQQAWEEGCDVLLTGEQSHQAVIAAQDLGIGIIFAGHYATERYGVLALGALLKKTFKVKTVFFADDTGC
ncbi:MAG: Nif3-like dinuclear metal center hexameric protein [Candidatus Woesearchaeota archaeon]